MPGPTSPPPSPSPKVATRRPPRPGHASRASQRLPLRRTSPAAPRTSLGQDYPGVDRWGRRGLRPVMASLNVGSTGRQNRRGQGTDQSGPKAAPVGAASHSQQGPSRTHSPRLAGLGPTGSPRRPRSRPPLADNRDSGKNSVHISENKDPPEPSGGVVLSLDIGRSGRIRTPDHWFWRPALYQTELRSCGRNMFGTPGGTRTPDARLRTPPLYPLSYRGWLVEIGGVEPPTSALRTPRSPN